MFHRAGTYDSISVFATSHDLEKRSVLSGSCVMCVWIVSREGVMIKVEMEGDELK